MTKNLNTENIIKIIQDTLKSKNKITIDSEMNDTPEWDSFGHLEILINLDKKFNGKVANIKEMSSATSIKKIIKLLSYNKLISNE